MGSEPCLPGTNVVVLLGLMSPATGVEAQVGEENRTSLVQLVHAHRVPGRQGAFLEAKIQGFSSPASHFCLSLVKGG